MHEIFSGPLHGVLIHSFAFLFLLSFPQHLMAGKFLNWSHKERISSKALSALSQMWAGQQGDWAVSSRQQLVRSYEEKDYYIISPLFSGFTCLLQQPHSPVERASQ